MTHTRSLKNPYGALAESAYLVNRQAERECPDLHIPTAEEERKCIEEWDTDTGSTRIAHNLWILFQRTLHLDGGDIRDLARAIKLYGDERAESALELYLEQGE